MPITRKHLAAWIGHDLRGYALWIMCAAGETRLVLAKGKTEKECISRARQTVNAMLDALDAQDPARARQATTEPSDPMEQAANATPLES